MLPMDRAPRHLVIVRHAKAESGEEGSDHDRRLTRRGQADATATGRWLAGHIDRIDHAWVSSATRAQQTWEAMRPALPEAAEVSVGRDLYQAGPREVLQRVAATDVPVMVVVGHNPTMEQVLMSLVGDLHGLRAGAAAIVELEGDRGRIVELHQPEARA
jgi:phosphohistidine phosphatase